MVRLADVGHPRRAPLLGQPRMRPPLSASAVLIYRVAGGRLAEAWPLVYGLAFWRLAGLGGYGG